MFSTNDLLGWRAMYYTMAGVTVPATVIYAFLERPFVLFSTKMFLF